MKLKHIPIVLSLLGTTVCLLSAQTPALDPTAAPAATTPSTTTPATTPAPAVGDSTAPATGGDTTAATGDRPATYSMVSGDSCWSIAQKFGISVKALEKANGLTKSDVKKLRPGKVFKIPALPTPKPEKTTSTSSSSDNSPVVSTVEGSPATDTSSPSVSSPSTTTEVATSLPKPKRKKSTATKIAQSTTQKAAPAPSSTTTASTTTPDQSTNSIVSGDSPVFGDYYHPAPPAAKPVAKPIKLAKSSKPASAKPAPAAQQMVSTSTSSMSESASSSALSNKQLADSSIGAFSAPPVAPPPSVAPITQRSKGFFGFFQHDDSEQQSGWAARFHDSAEQLASHHISYGQSWHPPGEARSWVMDCSNTSRYIYKITTNLDLPRTASDQYYYLHLQNKAWDVPSDANDNPDVNYLRQHLKPGDLLFWENTYRPERQPPITHVMIFLGQDGQGRWLMAGSQSGHDGEHRHSGPDIYKFDPLAPSGGYTTWMGFVHHKGRFTAFGRPLAADPTKLARISQRDVGSILKLQEDSKLMRPGYILKIGSSWNSDSIIWRVETHEPPIPPKKSS